MFGLYITLCQYAPNNLKHRKKGMAQQLGRHLEPLDKTIKFQASPHKVQRKKEREQQRENNTQGWEGERQTSGARQNGREMVKTDRETGMSQSPLLLLTFQPCSQLAYIPVRSCCSSSLPLTLAVCCSVHCCVTVSALESSYSTPRVQTWLKVDMFSFS